ncbi:MAG: 1-acyl-sn-glycerol-3-phosphate acyltransferase [Silicimonas sp.]|nr:1-acyl-sn-glycerol-3-phosphate acyltransferase [Silicimonas sp.]
MPKKPGLGGWILAGSRALVLGVLVFGCLGLLLVVRLVERPVFGLHRPWTPWITVFVSRSALRIMGLPLAQTGVPMEHPGAIVANHSSWLDIFVLNAAAPLYFVSKSEVAAWPGIGWLARATGTVFVRRERREARAQTGVFEERLAAGHRLLFFPEGTSSDGQRVLPFKPTLFAALFSEELSDLWVQPVSVAYHAPEGGEPRIYGWWGDMDFGPHLLATLAMRRHGRIEVIWHVPLRVSDFAGRKQLAAEAERAVRAGHPLGSVSS